MSRIVTALFVAAALMSACSDDGGGDSQSAPTTLDVTATTSTTASPNVTTASTAPGVCPAASVPPSATEVATAAGDFDGDGRPDEVRAYRNAGDYYVQIGLAAGGGDTLLVRTELQAGLSPIGGFDVDGDGDDEAWLNVSFGGAVRVVGLFAFDDCNLAEVTRDGDPARFTINRTFLGGEGVTCAPLAGGGGGLTWFAASSADGTNFAGRTRMLRLEEAALTLVADDPFEVNTITNEFTFNCGSLTL